MRNLIKRLLIRLGLWMPSPMYEPTFIELMEPLAWRFYGERKDQEVNCILFNVTDE